MQASAFGLVCVCRLQLHGYVKVKTDEILNLHNTISKMKQELEAQKQQNSADEIKKEYSLQTSSQNVLICGTVGPLPV